MFDRYLVPIIQYPLRYAARLCIRLRIFENTVTCMGIGTTILILVTLWMNWYIAALCFVVINRICDGLDGAIARERKTQSASGGFIDIVIDFFFYGSVPLGMALSNSSEFAFPSILVLFFYMLSGVIFMASSSAAATLDMSSDVFAKKSLFYSVNLIEGSETIIFSMLCCLFPHRYPIVAYIMAGLLFVSLPFRVYMHFKKFKAIELIRSENTIHNSSNKMT